jgi:galactose mutarotase-like enzyme
MKTIDYEGQKIRRWDIGSSTYLAWPERGARLINWNLKYADNTVRDIIFWPTNSNLGRTRHIRGGNPILFPFSARTFDRGDIYFWRYGGVRRPMPMHGFALDGAFELTEIDDTGFSSRFLPEEADREAYPFEYEFVVTYKFRKLSLEVDLQLTNRDTQAIPWSPGHHFYFYLPWREGVPRSEYHIDHAAGNAWRHAPDGTLTPASPFTSPTGFDDPELANRIHTDLGLNPVPFGPRDGSEEILLYIGQGTKPPQDCALTTWSEAPEAPFYCVEPWMGPPNSPEHKRGFHLVEPGRSETFTVGIEVT